jgi:beta-N-acetylhexosaminidase
MTAHILFPRIDGEYPVTISEVFLHDLLRLRLGYEGVVITDGLSMGALANNYDIDLVLERALRYDVDLILLHDRYDIRDIMSRVMGLLESGRISEADIDRGVRRVLTLKEQYGLLD